MFLFEIWQYFPQYFIPNGLEENILHKHQKRDCSNHHAPKIIELTELKMCEIF